MENTKQLSWKEYFKIRAYEVNPRGMVTIQTICNFLQEAAGCHARHLGVSVEHLFEQGITWVLSRLHVEMNVYPGWQENVVVETWPSKKEKLFAIRDFNLMTQEGNEIGRATSSWMLIDLKTRKPVRIPDSLEAITNYKKGRSLQDPFEKLPQLQKIERETQFKVRLSDLDMNRHVNNVKYIEWGLEALPETVDKQAELRALEISFKAESNYGDVILSQCGLGTSTQQNGIYLHNLVKNNGERAIASMISRWSERKHT